MGARDLARFVRDAARRVANMSSKHALRARDRRQRARARRLARRVATLPPEAFEGCCDQFAPLVKHMAGSGAGTDACLALGCLPMTVHFYSPVPDIADLQRRDAWNKRSALAGIDLRPAAQLSLLHDLGVRFAQECKWPHDDPGDPFAFFTNNSGFSYGCAAALHSMVRCFRPHRIIEIGSGSSSRVISAALLANRRDGHAADYTVVDPYPAPALQGLPSLTRQRTERVELVELAAFDELDSNDILFVDSGHTVRIAGDVNYLILDVLPRLKPGALVHFHDIPMPYEYAETYCTNPSFRMFWTESYLLQAFLSLNPGYEVLLAMNYLMTDHPKAFRAAFPHYDPRRHVGVSHSFWIRRRS